MPKISQYYQKRFSKQDNLIRANAWKVLCKFFLQKYIKRTDTVIDFGAGYCEFINNISCKKKIAVDLNADTILYANKDVKVIKLKAKNLPSELNNKADVVFMSNFLEHLDTKEDLVATLEKAYQVLRKGGQLIIIQPNIDLVKERYWDFIDHKIVLNTKSIKELLSITNFGIEIFTNRFLPYTTLDWKFIFITANFIRLYLLIPSGLRPFAGQSFIVARKK